MTVNLPEKKSDPSECFEDKGVSAHSKQKQQPDALFRQFLFYLSFLPKTEKCT